MSEINIRQDSETYDNKAFLLLKTEKLSVAIHIVTGHLSGREPIREELRRRSLSLVEDVRAVVHDAEESLVSDTAHLSRAVEAILSSLYVAKNAKIIGSGNIAILEREYLELKNYFAHARLDETHVALPDGDTDRHIRETNVVSPMKGRLTKETSIGRSFFKGQKNEGSSRGRSNPTHPPQGVSRRESILNIIQGKNAYSLSDIASKISGVSEKTVQRDLLALVEERVLRKTGERRWSRYSRA